MNTVLLLVIAYLFGAIPTGYWVVKAMKNIDLRQIGSGSTGTTNVLRTAGKGAAALVFFVDVAKGYVPVLLSILALDKGFVPELAGSAFGAWLPFFCALLALIGHSKSIFLGWQGGKSAATGLGTMMAMNTPAALCTFGIFVAVVYFSRYVSLGSMLAVCASPLLMYFFAPKAIPFIAFCLCGAFYVVARHKANIKRLMEGTEPKIGQKVSVAIAVAIALCGLMSGVQAATVPADSLTPDERVNINVYKAANKAVVYITTITPTQDMFFRVVPSTGEGSGCILTSDGYILTNYHVVKDAKFVNVTFWDGTTLPAEITGLDPDYDMAVIKVNPGRKVLSVTKLGDSSALEVGRRCFVIGNPFGFDRTMTQGIVSMVGRNLTSVGGRVIKGIIQTDAPVNPGNSGGPLINTKGEMIGLTTAIYSRLGDASAQWGGIGFAIPINTVKRIFPELIAHHKVVRPDIGIKAVRSFSDKGVTGLMVLAVDPDGAAAAAGVQGLKVRVTQQGPFTIQQIDADSADIITQIDGVPLKTLDDLLAYIENKKAGQVVTLTIFRDKKLIKVPLKLSSGA